MEENRVVWFKTHLDAIPDSCKDCACHWCYLPLKKRKWGYSDELKTVYEKTVESWDFDIENQTDDYCCEFSDMDASIRDGSDVEVWRIEEKELDVNIAVKVHGGMVQEVYSDADVGVEVYDLDSSDFAEESELTETEQRERELDEQIAQPGWRAVW